MPSTIGLILAAGKGTRMRSELPKPIVPFVGKPMAGHIVDALEEAGVEKVAAVVGHGADQVMVALGSEVTYVLQKSQDGTAHAVKQAKDQLDWKGKNLIVFVGDSPLITPETVKMLIEKHNAAGAACSFLTADFGIHLPYARIVRNTQGRVVKVVEEKDTTDEEFKIIEYMSSHFIFNADELFGNIDRILPDPKNGEYYLTDIIDIFLNDGKKVEVIKIDHYEELVGFNTPEDLAWGEDFLKRQGRA